MLGCLADGLIQLVSDEMNAAKRNFMQNSLATKHIFCL